jgi:WD40 repeat protein
VLTAHSTSVESLIFTPDGQTLISGGSDALIRRWDVAIGRPIAPLGNPEVNKPVYGLAISHDGRTLADSRVGMWDLETGRPRELHSQETDTSAVACSPVDAILATGHDSGAVCLWDTKTQRRLGPPKSLHAGSVSSLAFSRKGRLLASASLDQKVILWDVAAGGELVSKLVGHTADVMSVAFAPDGRALASGSYDGTVIVWNVADSANPRRHLTLEGNAGVIWKLAYSPDGKTIASANEDGTVKLWDPTTGRERCTLVGHIAKVRTLAFSPDGSVLATGDAGGTIRLWRR